MKKPWIIWYECPHYFWTEFISATIHKLVRKVQFSPFLFFARLFDLYTELQIRDQTNFGSTSDEYSYVAPWGLKICKDSRFVSINPPFCWQASGWLPVCWQILRGCHRSATANQRGVFMKILLCAWPRPTYVAKRTARLIIWYENIFESRLRIIQWRLNKLTEYKAGDIKLSIPYQKR